LTQLLNTDTDEYCHTGGHVYAYTHAHANLNTGVDSRKHTFTDPG
jgi:hypothetical protein